jgi:hypothetical protein
MKQIFPSESIMPPPTSRKSDESKLRLPTQINKKRLSNQKDGESQFTSNSSYDKKDNFLAERLLKYSNEMKTQPYLNPNQQEVEMQLDHKLE